MTRDRWLAVGALIALGIVETVAPHLPEPPTAFQVAWIAVIVLPLATVAITLVAVPAVPQVWLGGAAVVGIAASAALIHLGYATTPASVTKLIAAGAIGLLLGSFIHTRTEVLGVAAIIAVVDIVSVAAGPTHEIVAHHQQTLDALTLNLHPIGSFGVAQIGCSDLVFFAFFTAAVVVLDLRRWVSWVAMTASFGLTLALAYGFDVALPALPLLSVAFVAVNFDRLRPVSQAALDSPKRE
jgi:hypothetical protein